MAFTNYIIGTDADVGIGASGQVVPGGTFVDIAGGGSISFTVTNDTVPFDMFGVGYDVKRYGRGRMSGSIDLLYDAGGDAAHTTLLTSVTAKTINALRVRPQGNGAFYEFAVDVLWTSYALTVENNGNVKLSVSFESTGTMTTDANQA